MKTKLVFTLTLLISFLISKAQTLTPQPAMADTFRADGKINVVIAVLAIIFLCIIAYLIYIDNKVRKIEQRDLRD
jgi:uncharacterized membrane protein YdbT with pleckstrin-like domain